jgi:hypothetical protein
MVALNTAYTSSKTFERSQNRVGDFFCEGNDCAGSNRLVNRIAAKEKSTYAYETASGRPFWPNRDPLGEGGGLNLYGMLENDLVNQWDLLGLKVCFDQDAFDPCASDCANDLQHCLDAADIAYDSCKNAADVVHGACYNLCENNTNSFLRNACRRGCDLQKGVGNSICFAAYVGMTSGCGNGALACTAGCAAGATYTVDEGCPCDR